MGNEEKEFLGIAVRWWIILTVLAIIGSAIGLGWKAFYAPKNAEIDRQVFENTKSYRQGMIQELDSYYVDYNKSGTTESQKDAISSVVLHRVADFDMTQNDVPDYLRTWVQQLRDRQK